LKFDEQLETWLKKSKVKNQTKKERDAKAEIDQIKGQIKENWKLNGQLKVKVHNSKNKNQDKNGAKLWSWWLSLKDVELHEIKSLRDNYGCN
jgi:hypothetical protein